MHDFRGGANHGVIAYAAELMEASTPADVDAIAELHVPAECRVAAHDEVVANETLMRDVTVSQQ